MRALPLRGATAREPSDRGARSDFLHETVMISASRASRAPAETGALVSHYRIVQEIGRGAMAHVYRATDVRNGREVALKVPIPESERGPDTIRRFLREVRLAARLVHPNIVALYGGFEHAGLPWLAMELVEGPTLGEMIDRHGPLPLADVVRHGAELASALGLAHARGILHHDVSPGNILIAADGRAKIADFGLAGVLSAPRVGSAGVQGRTLESSRRIVAGTAGYMAPEKIRGERPDPRSDLFSLGAVLYEMSTGRPAFPGSTPEEILEATLETEPAAFAPSSPDPSGGFERIVLRALAKSPEERHPSAEELQDDLSAFGRRTGV
jgi:eukaryotic-like serine/threonine-protein kinase